MTRLALIRYEHGFPDCVVPVERVTLLGMVPRVTRLLEWDGPLPEMGQYLETRTGKLYMVLSCKPNTRPNAKSVARLDILALDPEEALPKKAKVHRFRWIGSKRRSKR